MLYQTRHCNRPYSEVLRMVRMEPYRLTATEALQAFSNSTLSVENYAKSLLEHISQRQTVVQAWEYLNAEQVLEQARALDKLTKTQQGPLHGVAIAVKDVIYTKGMATQLFPPSLKRTNH